MIIDLFRHKFNEIFMLAKSHEILLHYTQNKTPGFIFTRTVSSKLLGFVFSFFLIYTLLVLCAKLSWFFRQLLSTRKYTISYRIVS